MWYRPRMFGPMTSSNGRSTDTPPRWTIAPQPSARRRIVTPSFRSARVNDAPAGTGSGNGAISLRRSVQPSAVSAFVSIRPRLPDAPVSNTGLAGASVMALSPLRPGGRYDRRHHALDRGAGPEPGERRNHQSGAGGGSAR